MPQPIRMRVLHLPLFICLLALTQLLTGCGGATKGKDEFSIQGKIQGMANKELSLERITPSKSEPVQKVTLDGDGAFSLVAKAEPNTLFQLRAQDGKRMLLYPETDALDITADAADIDAFAVKGSPKTERLRDFNREQYRLYMAYKVAEAALDGIDRLQDSLAWLQLEGKTDSASIAYNGFLRAYCDTVSLPLLRAHAALSITPLGNYDYLQRLTQRIAQETPGSAYASFLDGTLAKESNGRIGEVAPPLTGTDRMGLPFDLTNLRGQRVLLFFWASYCVHSQIELAQIKDMQTLLADKKVRLVCFSIDDYPQAWQSYLQSAGLDWATHLRGLGGQQSEEIKRFKLKGIPSNYLIDTDGKVLTLDMQAADLSSRL